MLSSRSVNKKIGWKGKIGKILANPQIQDSKAVQLQHLAHRPPVSWSLSNCRDGWLELDQK